MSDYYRDLNENEKIIHWLETIVGRLDVMNNNLISILKYQQQGLSVVKGTTRVKFHNGEEYDISECMEDNGGYIHHVHWCKGECNL
jgi:hypothetical protein